MTMRQKHWSAVYVEDAFVDLFACDDGMADVVITDPPYTAHVHANMSSGTAMKKRVSGGRGGIPKVRAGFHALCSFNFARHLVGAARRWAIAFCDVESFGAYRDAVGAGCYVRSGIWIKPNAMGQLTGDRPASAYEGLAIMHRAGKKQWNGRGAYGYWVCNGTRGEKGRHPNQKPLTLCLELVAKFSNRGECVFDPFMGSGRIGEACLLLGRRYIGWDQSRPWVARASERLMLADARFGAISDDECMQLCNLSNRGKHG